MRILFVTKDFKPSPGGVAEYTHGLAAELVACGDAVGVYAPIMEGCSAHDRAAPYTVVRHEAFKRGGPVLAQLASGIGRVRRFCEQISQFRPDVCIFNSVAADYFCGYVACRAKRVPMVLFTYGMDLKVPRPVRQWMQLKWVLGAIEGVVSCSEYTRRLVHGVALLAPHTACVYPGIEPPRGSVDRSLVDQLLGEETERGAAHALVVSVCRHVRRKGLDNTLRAFPEVLREVPAATYVIGGTGPDTERLKDLTAELGLESRVRFVGPVSEPEKQALLAAATCLVMPSRELPSGDVEGFGIVYLEAAMHAVPSIGGASGGVPEAVLDGKTGLIVDPTDPKAIANAMIRLLTDDELRHSLGQNARQRALEDLNWPKQAAKLREFLLECTSRRRASHRANEKADKAQALQQ